MIASIGVVISMYVLVRYMSMFQGIAWWGKIVIVVCFIATLICMGSFFGNTIAQTVPTETR